MLQQAIIEGLESRLFLSVTPVFSATIKADRLAVKADLLKFRSDIYACESKLLTDGLAIKKNIAKGDTSLVAPFLTLRSAVKAMRTTLREERLTESANALVAESVIKLDYRQILKDRGNATAETADHAKLQSDRAALQDALIAGLDSRVITRLAAQATLATDTQGIVTAANNDLAASAALKAAVATFSADRIACLTTLTTDLQSIASARTTLAADLTAGQAT